MGNSPAMKATVRGIVMQALMVFVGTLVPAVGQMPNFYAMAGTVLAVLTGAMAARMSPGAGAGQVATHGAMAGGVSSLVGGVIAVAAGQWPDFQALQLLYPLVSGGIGGAVGGMLGRLIGTPATVR